MSGYQRVCLLAEGGMGFVELALRKADRFERVYALKRAHPHLRRDPAFRAMFLDEARVAGLVRDPHVVSVLDVGEDADGPFLVMEYVEGQPLSAVIAALREDETLPLAMALSIAGQVARGLHAAHELCAEDGTPLGLIHRDVSPQNILVGYDGLVRVTDFGIAKALGNLTRTSTGMLKGNVGYMAPEYLRFEAIDRRADLFSLGVVLHEMLAGQRLYPGPDSYEAARRILYELEPDILDTRPDVPPALVELLFELLAKEPARRPATALQVAERLEAIQRDSQGEASPSEMAAYMQRQFARERRRTVERIETALRSLLAAPAGPVPDAPAAGGAPAGAPSATGGEADAAGTPVAPGRLARRWGRVAAIGIALAALGAGALLARRLGPARHGLVAEYFLDRDLRDLAVRRIDPQLAFDWHFATPHPRIGPDAFSARWTGSLVARFDETTTLCTKSEDGARLWLDGELIIDNWKQHAGEFSAVRPVCADVPLRAGRRYSLRIEYFQNTGYAAMFLLWASPSLGPLRPVPSERLVPR